MEELKEYTYKWYKFGCKDASYLKIKEDFYKLNFFEKTLLIFHLATCKYCRRFVKQIFKINTLLKKVIANSTLKLSEKKKLTLNQLITENLDKK